MSICCNIYSVSARRAGARLHQRIVDIEMPSLFVMAAADAVDAGARPVIARDRTVGGRHLVRTKKQGNAARDRDIEQRPLRREPSDIDWSADLVRDVDACAGKARPKTAGIWLDRSVGRRETRPSDSRVPRGALRRPKGAVGNGAASAIVSEGACTFRP